MSEPSVWWPIPVTSSRWFSEQERLASRRYHRPIERAAVLRAIAQGVGLLLAWWFVDFRDPVWWWQVVAVLMALTLPRVVADAWHEFVHEPRFGATPVAPMAFVATTVGRAGVEAGLLTIVLAVVERVGDSRWQMLVVTCLAASMPMVSAVLGPKVVLLAHRSTDVARDHAAHRHVASLAAAHRLAAPRLVQIDRASFEGANAYVTGHRSGVTVAVSRQLLAGPDDLLRHVVGHEITHLSHRHLGRSAVAASISVGLAVAGALAITAGFTDGSGVLPLFVIAASVLGQPFRLALAWLSRANERQADRWAMRHAPIAPELIKQLHLSDRPVLEPWSLSRWQSAHPTPAERLEAASRKWMGSHAAEDHLQA